MSFTEHIRGFSSFTALQAGKIFSLAMVIIQYVIAVAVILISLKAASYITDIHPDGYRDMILSFSIPYFIGAVVYYISLMLEVRKQNRILENIKKDRK